MILAVIAVSAVKCIYLMNEPTITIGSAYQSDVFYQYHNQIAPTHGVFYFEHHDFYYKDLVENTVRLVEYGDTVKIYGLKMMYLKKILTVSATSGDFRVAVRERRN